MKKEEYIGRFVRMNRKIETTGGVVIPDGSILEITATWRGKFTVSALDSTPNDMGGSHRQACKGVSEYEFDLLPEHPREQARLALVAALEIAKRYGLEFKIVRSARTLSQQTVYVAEVAAKARLVSGLPKKAKLPW